MRNEHWLGAITSNIPRRRLKNDLKIEEEDRRVMLRRHKSELEDMDWKIWLTKDHLSLPYKKQRGW